MRPCRSCHHHPDQRGADGPHRGPERSGTSCPGRAGVRRSGATGPVAAALRRVAGQPPAAPGTAQPARRPGRNHHHHPLIGPPGHTARKSALCSRQALWVGRGTGKEEGGLAPRGGARSAQQFPPARPPSDDIHTMSFTILLFAQIAEW